MRLIAVAFAGLLAGAIVLPANAQDRANPADIEAFYEGMFKNAKDDWKKKTIQDETQKVCSTYHNDLPKAEFEKVLAREKTNVKMPVDGNVMGDWRSGEKIAQSGFGGRFNDQPGTINGGNCYACHQLTRQEVSFGTLGPSLLAYGKNRKYDPKQAATAFAKIYNAQSAQPCSNMPRFGHNGFLSEQQIKDLIALLFDKDSPVNN